MNPCVLTGWRKVQCRRLSKILVSQFSDFCKVLSLVQSHISASQFNMFSRKRSCLPVVRRRTEGNWGPMTGTHWAKVNIAFGQDDRTQRVSPRKSFPAEQNPASSGSLGWGWGVNKAEPTRNLVGPGHLPPDLATPFASYSSIV